ncbi:MAG: carbon-nitrogen hydrolase family protein [Thermoplasmata archaeon]|nr:MAG: carbon-nitrogen hydrolase family protein [Thermoplasmata archaeon]
MKISLVSARPKIARPDENLEKMKNFAEKIDADLIAFGELFLSGYMCKDELRDVAQDIDGKAVRELSKVAMDKDCYIIFGMPLKEKLRGIIRNAAVLVHPDGKVDAYKKIFLPTFGPFEEKLFFDEGEELKAFETRFGKIGIMICYDLFFPEVSRAYALQGADLLVCISASPSTTKEYFEKLLPARALENTVFLAYTNLVGTQEDLVFWGGSQIYDPLGKPISKMEYFKEGYIVQEIDFGEIERARASRPVLRDLKPEIYHDLYRLSRGEHLLQRSTGKD